MHAQLRASTATLEGSSSHARVLSAGIEPIAPWCRLWGPAFTVQTAACDNSWIHRAIYDAGPGDVLAVGGAITEAGYWGELMTRAALRQRLGGLLLDGMVRDLESLAGLEFPIFCRGSCPRGTSKATGAEGSIGSQVKIGDVVVDPGDLIVADLDGVVVLPAHQVPSALRRAAALEAKEESVRRDLESGSRLVDLILE